jgi:hypothetical protein
MPRFHRDSGKHMERAGRAQMVVKLYYSMGFQDFLGTWPTDDFKPMSNDQVHAMPHHACLPPLCVYYYHRHLRK